MATTHETLAALRTMDLDSYLTVEEAAKLLGCRENTLRKRMERERAHITVRKVGWLTLLPRSALSVLDKRPLT